MRHRAPLGVIITAIVIIVPVAASADADLDEVSSKREQTAMELRTLLSKIEAVNTAVVAGEDEVRQLDARERRLAAELASLERSVTDRVRSAVMHVGVTDTMAVIPAGRPDQAIDRAQILAVLARRDKAAAESITAARQQHTRLIELIDVRVDQLREQRDELERTSAKVSRRLDDLRAAERELKEVERRGAYACIQASPYSFIDSWGYARSGGRTHQGTDVMAPYGNKVYAFTAGRISRMSTGGLGGITLYLQGNDGTSYYYAHLSRYAAGIAEGTSVDAGQLIAFNGASGNAAGTPPHVHFEAHPGGGAAVNPYPMLRQACP
jgi:murein DD-endopeptidase MepM/ murein hydrolase activator NlpD